MSSVGFGAEPLINIRRALVTGLSLAGFAALAGLLQLNPVGNAMAK
jgi:hypothetical protein